MDVRRDVTVRSDRRDACGSAPSLRIGLGRVAMWAAVVLSWGVPVPRTMHGGNIIGRIEGPTGGGLREAVCWAIGAGANPATAQGMGMHYDGAYRIEGLSGGVYNMCAHRFAGLRHAFVHGVEVPGSGDVEVVIRHGGAMAAPGFTWLDPVSEAGQTFVATGRHLWSVEMSSAAGGIAVQATVHEGGPGGRQIGPARLGGPALYPPAIFRWGRGEVPLQPGGTYFVRFVRVDGPAWLPCLAKDLDPFPNGHAYLDGKAYPFYDLNMRAVCIDDGYIHEISTQSGYRSDQQFEIGQTFLARGEELRLAQFHLASGAGLMRVSVHDGVGGPQIGPAKKTDMGTYFPGTALWGPGELPLTPGKTYCVKLRRDDGRPFGIYGTADGYPDGELYLDGVPSGVDADCTFISTEPDLPDVVVGNVRETGITGLTATVAWDTDVAARSYVRYWKGSPPEVWRRFSAYQDTLAQNHVVTLRNLEPATTYAYRVYSWRDGHDPGIGAERQFTTSSGVGTMTGTVFRAGGGPIAQARVRFDPGAFEAATDAGGAYSIAVPDGTYAVTASAYGYEEHVEEDVVVPPGGVTARSFALEGFANLVGNGGFESGLNGWTAYGTFDGAMDDGAFAVPARTGARWAGSVGNWSPKTGGIHQAVPVDPQGIYTVRGFVFTDAFDISGSNAGDGHAQARIGYDPGGLTDPAAPTVVWTKWAFTAKQWRELTLTAAAPGGVLTVFLETRHSEYWGIPAWFKAGFDDVSVSLTASAVTGTLSGTVKARKGGLPLEGALVEITGAGRSAVTNEDGAYTIPGVAPGRYDIRASKAGYVSLTRADQAINAGETTVVHFALPGDGLPLELVNPSFETGDDTGWSWHAFEGEPDGVFGPGAWYAGISAIDGDYGYGVASSWGYKAGALYQKIQALKGKNYSASCWVRTHQVGGGDGDVWARVGISPTGSTDPTSGVVWGERVSAAHGWRQATVSDVPVNGTEVTVFCQVGMSLPREWQICALDDFSLAPEGGIPTTPAASSLELH